MRLERWDRSEEADEQGRIADDGGCDVMWHSHLTWDRCLGEFIPALVLRFRARASSLEPKVACNPLAFEHECAVCLTIQSIWDHASSPSPHFAEARHLSYPLDHATA